MTGSQAEGWLDVELEVEVEVPSTAGMWSPIPTTGTQTAGGCIPNTASESHALAPWKYFYPYQPAGNNIETPQRPAGKAVQIIQDTM